MALFSMHPDKSPGPDGMNPAFSQRFWNIIGPDTVKECRQILSSGKIPQNLNDTLVVLIPKKANPEVLADLRPISLCNVLIKIITKMLANRMKNLLSLIISEEQSAFIPGRLITDNVIAAFEINHWMRRKTQGRVGYSALKIDMSKAYDRIEWDFLRALLCKVGFDDWWVQLILKCVTTVRYDITHGARVKGPVIPSRGLRQGDPLSPYLFILCVEGLSALLRKYENQRFIQGIQVCRNAPRINHLLFADDSYLFSLASEDIALKMADLLQSYEEASGQQVNLAKSSVIFSANVGSEFSSHSHLCYESFSASSRSYERF